MIVAHQYVCDHTDNLWDLDADLAEFERKEAFQDVSWYMIPTVWR